MIAKRRPRLALGILSLAVATLLMLLSGPAGVRSGPPSAEAARNRSTGGPTPTPTATATPTLCDASGLGDRIWPTCSTTPPAQSSPFGPRQMASEGYRYDWHRGVDIPLPFGSPVYATLDGTVRLAGDYEFYSDTLVQLRHGQSAPYLYSNYTHLSGVTVQEDDPVSVGDLIGYSGESASGFDHLHLEFRDGCVYQDCNRNPWEYLPYADQAPATPALHGANAASESGTLLLLEGSVPDDQLDLDGLDLTWGADTVQVSFNAVNATTPREWPEALDDPVIALGGAVQACLFPDRFNSASAAAGYRFAFWGLDANSTSGSAALRDLNGPGPSASLSPLLAPLSLSPATQHVDAVPGATAVFVHALENTGSQPLTLTLSAQSAQSTSLSVSPSSLVLAPGASQSVNVTLNLSAGLPSSSGDCVVLEVDAGTGSSTIALDSVTISPDVATPTSTPTPMPTATTTITSTPTETPTATDTPAPCLDTDGDTLCNEVDFDDDSDGCTDVQELGASAALGGQRDPLSFWDFYDAPNPSGNVRDQVIDVGDLHRVVDRFGTFGDESIDPLSGPPSSGYHTAFDRSAPPPGADPWDLGPPDGTIDASDISFAVNQFGHSCA